MKREPNSEGRRSPKTTIAMIPSTYTKTPLESAKSCSITQPCHVCEATCRPRVARLRPAKSISSYSHRHEGSRPQQGSTHLQKMFPQMELMPRNSSNGGALGAPVSATELYDVRSDSYFPGLPVTTMQFRQTCIRCFLRPKGRKRKNTKKRRVKLIKGDRQHKPDAHTMLSLNSSRPSVTGLCHW